jgi:hypothetical protein
MTVNAQMYVQNDYNPLGAMDMRFQIWTSNGAAFSVAPSSVQLIDFGPGEYKVVQWTLTALPVGPGTYTISAIVGNNEIPYTSVGSAMLMVV